MFGLYERILCRLAAGFIGWTPYLAGRALTFGTRRVMTAPGWAPFVRSPEERSVDRIRTRERLGIPTENLVIGIAGSMAWLPRYEYCYGWELVEAAWRITRPNVNFLLIGDGSGRRRLENRADRLPNGRVIFTGRVEQDELPGYYASMDIGSLPQSVDAVGSFRYTTKLGEYLAFRLPVITGQTPMSYDCDDGWLWRIPGDAPWSQAYVSALARLIDRLTSAELSDKRAAIPALHPDFDYRRQSKRVTAFVSDLLAGAPGHPVKTNS
jgi:glycosyltransferase involved in cell wall biosynthesis